MLAPMKRTPRLPSIVLVTLTLACLSGCSSVAYYSQAIAGQTSILLGRQPLETVIKDPATSPDVADKLRLIQELRAFASAELKLPVDDAYATYVDTGRDFVVWNVFAAPEFSLRMKTFCYPVAGCVSYRGYFAEADAARFAGELADEGYDVFVGGVAAYSTLGWFADPVLNTFVRRSRRDLAALIFHELAHRAVYLKGDTTFNESFATAVAEVGVSRWLGESDASLDVARYAAQRERRASVLALIGETRTALTRLYAREDLDPEGKRAAKAAEIQRLRQRYGELRETWSGHRDFAAWMASDLNNARLGTVADYNSLVPAFHQLLADNGGDLVAFYTAVQSLADLEESSRRAAIDELVARSR